MEGENYQRQIIECITRIVGQANILTIPRVFIDYTGDIKSALLLSQLLYWSGKTKTDDGWVYKTYQEWNFEISLSKNEVYSAVKRLKALGILKTKVQKANGNPTVHYKIPFSDFQKSFFYFLNKRMSENQKNDGKAHI